MDLHVSQKCMKVWVALEGKADAPLWYTSMHAIITEYMPQLREMPADLPILNSTGYTPK